MSPSHRDLWLDSSYSPVKSQTPKHPIQRPICCCRPGNISIDLWVLKSRSWIGAWNKDNSHEKLVPWWFLITCCPVNVLCTLALGTPIYDFHAPKTHSYGCMAAMYICNYTYAQYPLPTLVIIALTLAVVLQYLFTFLQYPSTSCVTAIVRSTMISQRNAKRNNDRTKSHDKAYIVLYIATFLVSEFQWSYCLLCRIGTKIVSVMPMYLDWMYVEWSGVLATVYELLVHHLVIHAVSQSHH